MYDYDGRAVDHMDALKKNKRALVLAIETSCDETAAAIVRDGRDVLSNVVHSQISIHRKYGGVVPEVASRNHVGKLPEVVACALGEAGVSYDDLDAVAVTAYPGLVGALITGVSYAKGLAYARGLPLLGVNHIMGHIAANYISHRDLAPPFVCLVASGGHSHLFYVESYTRLRLLGRTRDDAAGEAFDKVARVLGLPYPGGPELEKLAKCGNQEAYIYPMGFNAGKNLDFSFSGLKTAVINQLHTAQQHDEMVCRADIAASFQKAVIDVLTRKSLEAAQRENCDTLVLSGGVSANLALQATMRAVSEHVGLHFFAPELRYCGDNAAMIGCAAFYALVEGNRDDLGLNAAARWTIN